MSPSDCELREAGEVAEISQACGRSSTAMWSVMVLALAGPTPMLTMRDAGVIGAAGDSRHLRQTRRRRTCVNRFLAAGPAAGDHAAWL